MSAGLILNSRADFQESSRKKTPEGYLTAKAVIARKGVLGFYLNEIFEDVPKSVNARIPVLMGDEFFDTDDFSESVARKPVTLGHPPSDVGVDNYRNYAVGHLGDNIYKEDDLILADMTITDPSAVKMIENGKDELSVGFRTDVKSSKGSYKGKEYQLEMLKPIINHVALLDRGNGRAGSAVRILNEETKNMSEEKQEQQTPVIGKLQVELSAAPPSKTDSAPESEVADISLGETKEKSVESVKQAADIAGGGVETATVVAGKGVETATAVAGSSVETATVVAGEGAKAAKAVSEGAKAASGEVYDKAESAFKESVERIARFKTKLIANARPYLDDDVDPYVMSEREILESSLKNTVTDLDDKSDDYLLGRLDAMVQSRNAASKERKAILVNSDPSASSGVTESRSNNVLDIIKTVKGVR